MAIGLPMLAIAPRLAPRLAEGARGVEAALVALPSVPPDWVAQIPLAGRRWPAYGARQQAAGGNLHVLLEPYADWLRGSVLAAAHGAGRQCACNSCWRSSSPGCSGRRVKRSRGNARHGAALGRGHRRRGAGGRRWRTAQRRLRRCGHSLHPGDPDGDRRPYRRVPAPVALGFLVLLLAISQIGAVLLPLVWGGAAWWLFHHGRPGLGHLHARLGLRPRLGKRQPHPTMADRPRRGDAADAGDPRRLRGLPHPSASLACSSVRALLAIAFTLVRAWRDPAGRVPEMIRRCYAIRLPRARSNVSDGASP